MNTTQDVLFDYFYVNSLKRRKTLFGRNFQNFSQIGCVYGYKQETVGSMDLGISMERIGLSDAVGGAEIRVDFMG